MVHTSRLYFFPRKLKKNKKCSFHRKTWNHEYVFAGHLLWLLWLLSNLNRVLLTVPAALR